MCMLHCSMTLDSFHDNVDNEFETSHYPQSVSGANQMWPTA